MSRRMRERRQAVELDAALDRAGHRRPFVTARLYLLGLFLVGALSAGAGVNWLRTGEIVFRSSEPSASDDPDGDVIARIDREDPIFFPIALCWLNLGSGIAALAGLSLFVRERLIERSVVYACIGLIFLAVATSLVGSAAG
ncbi:MAG TPA: hypothetical protein VGN57_03540 [Pirellulaceae bacterium]|jgi:hypothetical protein|nr:hypothetical protein [Pirellulaceae bacterium]